jgi:hypothetical protein
MGNLSYFGKWSKVKEFDGTINACISKLAEAIKSNKELQKQYPQYVGKSVSELNKLLYKEVKKSHPEIGEKYDKTVTRKVQGAPAKITRQEVRKCSLFWVWQVADRVHKTLNK